ncbi:Aldolase-type TIM barrel [Syntrophomonas zehnderi OL-4]|uniref:glutamate synthase (NADPH) n=1 Tax=Syntrophomonas zehnderi OL-4 TaxID=690567 RepID=A0A0E4GB43_9FIRM|nr:glutamate synthase-related protein [Syntrophomonas zehnderi]CFX56290.1 Aldolase-type TIM barrel [Syntrophomonas zehnderi OL-4]
MAHNIMMPAFKVQRDEERCIRCGVCVRQCANNVHNLDEDGWMWVQDDKCVACHRCAVLCPTRALNIIEYPLDFRGNQHWTPASIREIYAQAQSGGVLLSGMGNPRTYKNYFDHLLINASQVTNPSIDPLREPMEMTTYLGNKNHHSCGEKPQLKLDIPLMFSAMSFGSVSINVHKSLAVAAKSLGTFWNTGEGGLHPDLLDFGRGAIVQVASGRFGVHPDYLDNSAAVEIKIGQGAKPGIGGHLPGEKVSQDVSLARMIPAWSDAISPAPHHDIYSIEDLAQLIETLKVATRFEKPIAVKVAAVHNITAIASGVVRAGADILVIDGFRGGTGAAPMRIRDNVGIPVEMALAQVDSRLRDEGIRSQTSLVISGGIRNSADVMKAIALGADAVYIATAALIALGCHMCQMCFTGLCNWGIATTRPDLTKRLNPHLGSERAINLLAAWKHEMMEMMGGMGINAIESLRGNRLMLRGIGLSKEELGLLGVKGVGE